MTNEQEPVFAEEPAQKFDWVKWGARALLYVAFFWGIPLIMTLSGADFLQHVLIAHSAVGGLVILILLVWFGFRETLFP